MYQANHQIHIIDTHGSETKTLGNDALNWAGSRARMDLYVSELQCFLIQLCEALNDGCELSPMNPHVPTCQCLPACDV